MASNALGLFNVIVPLVSEVVATIRELKAERAAGEPDPTEEEIVARLRANRDRVNAKIDAWEAANPIPPADET